MATREETETQGLHALSQIDSIINSQATLAADRGNLCDTYSKVKPYLDSALAFIGLIPVWGPKIVVAVKLLIQIADTACSAGPGTRNS